MTPTRRARPRLAALALAAVLPLAPVLAACGSSGTSTPVPSATPATAAAPVTAATPATAGTDYLALGDSFSFGYRDPGTLPTPDYHDPSSFVGFPELVGAALHLHVTNASCTGETTASFRDASAPSNGCESSYVDGREVDTGYRTEYPLHVSYRGSQLAYALSFLHAHPDTTLVSFQLGANDAYLCEATTTDGCHAEAAATLARIRTNIAAILAAVRTTAGYRGQLVVVDYFSVDYANASDDRNTLAVDDAINDAARPFHVEIADTYRPFRAATAAAGYDDCAAGLLVKTASGACGHPDRAGQEIVARTVLAVVHR
jgi:lysophospholipase L1-like esterase